MKIKKIKLNKIFVSIFALIFTLIFTGCIVADRPFIPEIPDVPEIPYTPVHTNKLPVITINTLNSVLIADRETWVTMTFSLTDPIKPSNNIPAISGQQIRGRGNSSWTMVPAEGKKPYRIRFTSNQQQSPFGLPAARNWVLLRVGPDINTPFGFELGKRLGLQYTCSYNPVNVYLNGNYRGVYLFTEHRQADPAGLGAPGRPKVDLTEGWLIEIDRYWNEDPKFRTTNFNLPVMIKSPDAGGDSNNSAYNIVRNDMNHLANLMAADSFPENGYRDLVDIDTFIKFFIVQTIIINNDLFRPRAEIGEEIGSTFFHKDKDGLISAGPLWDLDWSFSEWEFEGRRFLPNTMPYQIHNWFRRFHEDPVFHARYKEIWNNNYQSNILTMSSFIDSHGAYVKDGALDNSQRWSPHDMNWINWHISYIKNHFSVRSAFLHGEYNKVDVLPATIGLNGFGPSSKNFGTSLNPQTFTLVAFGQMTNLSATLQKGSSSPFEIVTPLTQTPTTTGGGGYLATITVRPKTSLPAGQHTDVL
ncbi:MAG: CotH kinase family protein, partial [Treponema sp.]|nr:CotH kinase family protein [Treponema sp.]